MRKLSNFDRQVRYYVLRDIAHDLLDRKLITLSEYASLLAMLSQRYIKNTSTFSRTGTGESTEETEDL